MKKFGRKTGRKNGAALQFMSFISATGLDVLGKESYSKISDSSGTLPNWKSRSCR